MEPTPETVVLRLGHRPGRDDRMTTHVGLTARALGADRVIFPTNAADAVETTRDVTDRFGGPFAVETTDQPLGTIRNWSGNIAHLTMYGEPVQDTIPTVQDAYQSTPLLVVVGAEKVPFEVYDLADWNIGVTNQPHSEIAALAVFLDRLLEGAALDRDWTNPKRRVIPQATGKRVVDVTESDDTSADRS